MPLLTSLYWVVAWYFWKATAQPWFPSGGGTPISGFHPVMKSPERVSRVAPPTTTRPKTTAAVANSQIATSFDRSGVSAPATPSSSPAQRRCGARCGALCVSHDECEGAQGDRRRGHTGL